MELFLLPAAIAGSINCTQPGQRPDCIIYLRSFGHLQDSILLLGTSLGMLPGSYQRLSLCLAPDCSLCLLYSHLKSLLCRFQLYRDCLLHQNLIQALERTFSDARSLDLVECSFQGRSRLHRCMHWCMLKGNCYMRHRRLCRKRQLD